MFYYKDNGQSSENCSAATSALVEATESFIINNYGFFMGQDEYDYILWGITSVMQSYGFLDNEGAFINFLGYPQFKRELDNELKQMMDRQVEIGGEQLDLFAHCKA